MPAEEPVNLPYGLGWKPQRPDYRDLRAVFPASLTATLPPTNPRFGNDLLPPIFDQGELGSCTANAILRASNFASAKIKKPADRLSRLQLYYDEREIEGTTQTDSGAAIRDGIKSLVDQGACLETIWPYDISQFAVKPPPMAYDNAMKHQAVKYAAVASSLPQIKSALISGYPVIFGTPVYQSAMSQQAAQTGVWPVPGPFERQIGGHAIVFNGFWDDSKQLIGFDNSWSAGWGQNGSGYLPYWFVLNGMVSDLWIITEVESDLPQPPPTPIPSPTPDPAPTPPPVPPHGFEIHRPAHEGDKLGLNW